VTQQERETTTHYQTTISMHDKSIVWIYYPDLANYYRYHQTASNEVFKHLNIQTIIHKLDSDDSVIQFEEREKA